MTRLAGLALLLAAALVQVTWAPQLSLYGAFPNLVLVMVVAVAWTQGQRAGLLWACIGGLLLDLTSPGPLGPHALALLACAYVAGLWARNVDPGSVVQPAAAVAVGTAIYSMMLIGVDDTLGLSVPPLALAIQLTAAAGAYNAAFAVPVFFALKRIRPAVPA